MHFTLHPPSAHYHGSEIPCKNYLINGAKFYLIRKRQGGTLCCHFFYPNLGFGDMLENVVSTKSSSGSTKS